MRRRLVSVAASGRAAATLLATLALALLATAPARAAERVVRAGSVYARIGPERIVLGNGWVQRTWERRSFRTVSLLDRRGRDRLWSAGQRDFTLRVGGVDLGSDLFGVTAVDVARLARGGLRVTMHLSAAGAGVPGGLTVTRVAEAYPRVAGFRTQTTLASTAPLVLDAATLDEAAVGARVSPTIHAFRGGSDWREPGYEGPPIHVGDAHGGTWRDTHAAGAGRALAGPAQWLSAADGRRSLFMVMESNDFPSSRAAYDGLVARLRLDYQRDVLLVGPLEESIHIENPGSGPGRGRTVQPGIPFVLDAAFTGFGDGDGDEPWQFYRYLTGHRLAPYPKAITFNSNGTDDDRISTGAKDDMDLATIREVAPIARRLGIETFILDDGWQARSGDWQPDSPQYPEPRYDGQPGSKFAPRFPDAEFRAVRRAIAPMRLGLWMSPMHFHPSSTAYKRHPEWVCSPVGDALVAYNSTDPYSGSNEAGIAEWGPRAIPYIESRIRDGIEHWGVRYWKFDFLAWLDCAGQGDLHDFRDAFVAMLDRLRGDFPRVTFQIDETNDYRLFPFESISRGPTWFQNGAPPPERLLHNLWNLSPFVPGFALGQHVLGGRDYDSYPVATIMAAALPSHITFFNDLRSFPERVIRGAIPWLRFYKRHRALLAQMTYPLLEDPLKKRWTALQAWDPAAGRGALLAFRQDSNAPSRRIALRNVPPHRRFDLFVGPTDRYVSTVTSARLSRGLLVRLPAKRLARVLLILPAARRATAPRVPPHTPPRPRRPRFTG